MKNKTFTLLLCLFALTVSAQEFPYFTPRFQEYGFSADTVCANARIIYGVRGQKSVRKYAAEIPQQAGGYLIVTTPKQVVVAGNDADGLFYGQQSLQAIRDQGAIPCGKVRDWSSMPDRGVIEGFYGNPYTHQERLRLFAFMGRQKMNVFVYGPKDDPYHRSHWREPYPETEAARISELAAKARENHVQFVWAIHPGVDIRWNRADSLNVLKKLESMYKIGVRSFCVFFDDIGGEGTKASKQADLLNYLHKEFVCKHSDVTPLMMCPTQYNKGWSSGDYLNTLGARMDKSVRIMWTGNTVVDMINHADMEWINAQIGRKAYIWLNYPVTDYCIDHMLMGPTYGNDLDIADMVSGFCSNPMEYVEASKVSLFSIADYAWNTPAYDADASWDRALHYLIPEDYYQAFRYFCEHNVDLGPTGHGLRRWGESPRWREGEPADAAELLDSLRNCALTLMGARHKAPELLGELNPWLEATYWVATRGKTVLQMRENLEAGDSIGFIRNYKVYSKATENGRALRSRDFEGSIKTAAPVAATLYIEPWIRKEVKRMERTYREQGHTYGLEAFPYQLIPDGDYYIKVGNRFLTDVEPQTANARARFVEERDTINPQRQEWTIELSTATGRYSLICKQARRYLNEIGRFGSNPYNELWNTYQITAAPDGNGYFIRNAQNGGTKWWKADSEGGLTFDDEDPVLFQIIPIDSRK